MALKRTFSEQMNGFDVVTVVQKIRLATFPRFRYKKRFTIK